MCTSTCAHANMYVHTRARACTLAVGTPRAFRPASLAPFGTPCALADPFMDCFQRTALDVARDTEAHGQGAQGVIACLEHAMGQGAHL